MINKIVQSMVEAMAGIRDGSVVLLGGFGSIGQPNALIDGLIEHGAKDLIVVSNNAGVGRIGLARLLELGRVRKIICSFPRTVDPVVFEELYRAGKIELEIVPQGTLAERLRAAGAGIPAFFTATAVGTKLAAGKEQREIRRPHIPSRGSACRRRGADRGLGGGPLGQLDLSVFGAQFQSGHGDGGEVDDRAGAAHRRSRRARSGKNRDAGHLRQSRAACALRRARPSHEEDAVNVLAACKPLTRNEMAARLARDIPEGWYVNLGIGAPLHVADHVPAEREVIFHSENGVLGMGPGAGARIKSIAGSSMPASNMSRCAPADRICTTPTAFALIRGGHLDLCVLGAFQVAENGDIANWSTSDNDSAPAVGGAMDLAAGARQVWVLMEHQTKSGESRLVRRCTYPLTALGVVKRIYTNIAVLDVTEEGFAVREMAPGLNFEALQKATDAPLRSLMSHGGPK